MAFTNDELNVIRTYQAVNGDLPSQQELEQLMQQPNLGAASQSLIDELAEDPAGNAEAFVTSLYENLLGRDPMETEEDQAGLEYWVSEMTTGLIPRTPAEIAVFFWEAAAENGEQALDNLEASAADALESQGLDFGAEAPGNGDDGDEDPAPEITTDYSFNTEIGESNYSGWSIGEEEGEEETFDSQSNKIYNVGKQGIDNGVSLISANYSFELADQLGERGEYEAYFLSPTLDNTVEVQGNELILEVIDRHAQENDLQDSLSSVRIEAISFRLDGDAVEVRSEAMADAETYEELADAVRAELASMAETRPELAQLEVGLGNQFVREQTDPDTQATTGNDVVGKQIILTATEGSELETGGFDTSPVEGGNIDTAERQTTTDTSTVEDLIRTNIELENVGYDSQGGSINISGQSNSNQPVQQFDVTANDKGGYPVWLTSLSSNPLQTDMEGLEVINLEGDALNFHIGQQDQLEQQEQGDEAEAGISDVREFNASSFDGNIRVDAEVTDSVVERDLGATVGDQQDFAYDLGNGDNLLFLEIGGEVAQRADANFDIDLGNGDNTLFVNVDPEVFDLANQGFEGSNLQNLNVTAGSGDDELNIVGGGDYSVDSGAGDDTVYVNNAGTNAAWVVGGDGDTSADNAPITVLNDSVKVSFLGFEATAEIDRDENFQASQAMVNAAIAEAIQSDRVLNDLLQVNQDESGMITVQSRIDGARSDGDLEIDIVQGGSGEDGAYQENDMPSGSQLEALAVALGLDSNEATAGDVAERLSDDEEGYEGYEDITAINNDLVNGEDSDEENNSIINLGSGDNVVTLSTEEESNNTIEIDSGFARVSIVDFDDGAAGDAGTDLIDLTAYLGNVKSDSGSGASAEPIAGSFVEDADDLDPNDIATFDLGQAEFADLDANTLLAELNEGEEPGISNWNAPGEGWNESGEDDDLVGDTLNNVFMVENNDNGGEYKVFSLESSNSDGENDFTSASLIGTLDFGEEQADLNADNFVGIT